MGWSLSRSQTCYCLLQKTQRGGSPRSTGWWQAMLKAVFKNFWNQLYLVHISLTHSPVTETHQNPCFLKPRSYQKSFCSKMMLAYIFILSHLKLYALFLSSYHGHPSHVESAPYFSFLTWPSFPSQQSQTPRLLSFLNSVVALLPSKYGVTIACNRWSITLGFALCYLGTCPCGPAWSCVWACLVVRAIT